ncbi:MAG: putative T7SS-secreted protein [Actinomadura sp.]
MAELGSTSDPKALVPGSPEAISASAAAMTRYGESLVRAGEALADLDGGGWTGDAAEAFRAYFEGEPSRWLRCGDAFHSASEALREYQDTLAWAQDQAAKAIALWDEREAATEHAKAQHEAAVARENQRLAVAAAAGTPATATPIPFHDPGEKQRAEAQEMLNDARERLSVAGNTAAQVVELAQAQAPQERNLLEKAWDGLSDGVSDAWESTRDAAGEAVRDTGLATAGGLRVLGGATEGFIDGVGDAVGTGGGIPGPVGDWFDEQEEEIHEAADETGDEIEEAADEAEDAYDDVGDVIAGEDDDDKHYVLIDEERYPESADHIRDAQTGTIWRGDQSHGGHPLPSEVTIDRDGADQNRRESLRGIPSRGSDGLDRDEYPPAMFEEGGYGASVKYIDSSDNRGAGSSMGHQTEAYDDGTKVEIVVG